ncbi:hypothetical protein D3C81_1790260 [compost metagenome]
MSRISIATTRSGRVSTNFGTVCRMSPLTISQRGMRLTGRTRSLASIMSWISVSSVSENIRSLMSVGSSSLSILAKPSKVSKPMIERLIA